MKIERKRGDGSTTRAIVEVIHALIVEERDCTVLIMNGTSSPIWTDMLREAMDGIAKCVHDRNKVSVVSPRTGRTVSALVINGHSEWANTEEKLLIIDP